jgi:uncharacterized protein YkwD
MAARGNPRLIPAAGASAPFELVEDEVAIGSASGNDLVIGNPTVSRRHAKIARHHNRTRLADLGATNGTYVNGRRISEPVDLNDGDELRFGAAIFRFAAGASARRIGSRALTVIASIAILFAAAFAVTMHVVNFGRLQDAAELSPAASATAGLLPHAVASFAAGPTAVATAARAAPASPPAPSTISPGTAVHDSSSAADRLWLDPLNRYRESAGLAPVTANARFSRGDYLHSRYIVENFGERIAAGENLGVGMHLEDPSKPWFSVEGASAGRAGDVDELWSPRGTAAPSWAIDNWMQSPFHRFPILNPRLHSVGYGYDCEGPVCIAALNLTGDLAPVLSAPSATTTPIEYPPDGATIDMNSFDGEWPDPLASCAGYSLPTGYPITIQLGAMVNPGITSISFKQTAPTPATLETCAFDGATYINPDPGTEKMARDQLINYGAIVIMPRAALANGAYAISIIAGGHNYSWSFSVNH